MTTLAFVTCLTVLLAGLYGAATSRHLVHLSNCLSVCQTSAYIFLITIGYKWGARAPVTEVAAAHHDAVDPVVQSLAVTGIVVGAVVQALVLAIALQIHKHLGTVDPEKAVSVSG